VGGGVARSVRWLSEGLPRGLVATAAIVVLGLILYTVATQETAAARGFAEFTLFRSGCVVAPDQRQNVVGCEWIGPRTYRVNFTRSLTGSTVLASRGSCCPGQIRASIASDRTVLIAIPKVPSDRNPVRASVFVP
jgi:hypothetical protein